MKTLITMSFLALLLLGMTAHAESYISADPPPHNVLAQYIHSSDNGEDMIVGLYKDGENKYQVFYRKEKGKIDFKTIIHLDTDKWLIQKIMNWEEITIP